MYWPLGYLRYCAKRFGRIFLARGLFHPPMVVVADPDALHVIFRATFAQLNSFPANAIFLRTLGERSFVFKDGPEHQADRKSARPSLSRSGSPELAEMFCSVTESCVAQWPGDTILELHAEVQSITYRTAVRRFIGFKSPEDEDRMCGEVDAHRNILSGPFALLLYNFGSTHYPRQQRRLSQLHGRSRRAAEIQNRVRDLCAAELRRKQISEPSDNAPRSYLDCMVREHREHPEDPAFSEPAILDNLNLLLVTGHESAAIAVT
jgi:cytochrome P450